MVLDPSAIRVWTVWQATSRETAAALTADPVVVVTLFQPILERIVINEEISATFPKRSQHVNLCCPGILALLKRFRNHSLDQ